MRINFPAVLNAMLSLFMNFSVPTVSQKAGAEVDTQADSADHYAADNESASSEVDHDHWAPRWAYRGHYRSIFPPMF